MRALLAAILLAAGCSTQYTREQANKCAAAESDGTTFWAAIATDSPTHERETALAALPVLVDQLKNYPPGSTGADEAVAMLIRNGTDIEGAIPRLDQAATKEQIDRLLNPMLGWYNALVARCQGIAQRVAPS